ncbi:MAG: tetratricopeptide repeat protein [Clostridia bacterium]
MKKLMRILLVIAALTLVLSTAVGCSKKEETTDKPSSSQTTPESKAPESGSSEAPKYDDATKQKLDEICAKGKELYDAKKYAEAKKVLKTALDIDPLFVPALELLTVSCNFSVDYENSVKYSEAIIEANPNDSKGYYYKGLAFKAWKKLEDSIKWFTKATEINPKDTWSYYGIATIYADTNRKEPALEFLKKAIDTNPKEVKKTALAQDFHWQDFYNDPDFIALTK